MEQLTKIAVCELDSCCLCFSLRTGCFLIAILEIFISILLTIATREMTLSLLVVALSVSGLLIYSTITKERSYLRLWVTINIMTVFSFTIYVAICAINYYFYSPDHVHARAYSPLAELIITLVLIGIISGKTSFSFVVISYMRKLQEEEDSTRKVPVMTAIRIES